MEKIDSIINKVFKKSKDSFKPTEVFSEKEMAYIKRFFKKKNKLFVYLKSSPQVFEFNLKQQHFLKKAQTQDPNITKIVFRIS